MRLTDFIRANPEPIASEWETFARTLTPASDDMTPLALRDHIREILSFIVKDIESAQTGPEQVRKSRGGKRKSGIASAAEIHAALRHAEGFDIDQMVSEYRALRASVIKLWSAANQEVKIADIIDLTRFNESIDQILAESVSHYTEKVNESKDLLLGIISHDLRTPLSVITMSAELLDKMGPLNERQSMLTAQIVESTARGAQIIRDLLDVTHARFGSGLPIKRAPMDMGFATRQLVEELRAAHPERTINLSVSGDLRGEWDNARVGQVLSNLIGNAVQYSFEGTAIDVAAKGEGGEVRLSVHNKGAPIREDKMEVIFDALARAAGDEGQIPGGTNLGLGLYIAKDIVTYHGGTLEVASSDTEGTTFTARFPRAA